MSWYRFPAWATHYISRYQTREYLARHRRSRAYWWLRAFQTGYGWEWVRLFLLWIPRVHGSRNVAKSRPRLSGWSLYVRCSSLRASHWVNTPPQIYILNFILTNCFSKFASVLLLGYWRNISKHLKRGTYFPWSCLAIKWT